MYLNITYDQEFDELMMHLKAKYPKELFNIDGIGNQLDMNKFSKTFFSKASNTADVSVDANANVADYSVISYHHELPKPFFRMNSYFILWKKLKQFYGHEVANDVIESQLIGDIYINDFHGFGGFLSYCFAFSAYDVAIKGLPMISSINCIPPKYLYSFKSQVEQFTIIAANSILGASAIPNFLCIASWYIERILKNKEDAGFKFKTDEQCWKYISETLLSFIYTLNQPSRSIQAPFTNISIYDEYFLNDSLKDYVFPDGSIPNIEVVKKVQELFLDLLNSEMERTQITFPIITACFSVDDKNNIKDEKFLEMISEKNKKFGFINIFCGDSAVTSACCRLRVDSNNEYFNSFGSGTLKIGSLGVVTINLPRLAFKYKNDVDKFFEELRNTVVTCARINNVKRKHIQEAINNGYHPLYTFGFMDINKQYNTVGINGFNECIEIFGKDVLSDDGVDFGLEIINQINKENDKCQNQYKVMFNTEQIPAESTSIKLAKKDKILGFNKEYEMYSNQFIPLTTKADMLDRIKLQGVYDKHFSGGAICHINIENEIKDANKIAEIIKLCAKKGVVYFALNYNIQECINKHMTVGRNKFCSICGKEIINNYTRVVGFLTNTKNWVSERREIDYPNRQWY